LAFHQTSLRILPLILLVNLTLQEQKTAEINDLYTQLGLTGAK
jgi:hypothetical protein